MELLVLCHVFTQSSHDEVEDIRAKNTRILYRPTPASRVSFSSSPSAPSSYLGTHVLPPRLQFWKCVPEEDVHQAGDAWWRGGCQGNYQGLSYIPEIIWTELTSGHHDEGTLASRELDNSLPGNAMKTCSRYRYLPIAGKAPVRHHRPADLLGGCYDRFRDGLSIFTDWKITSYDSILVVIDRLTKNDSLRAGADTDRCTWACGGLYWPCSPTPRPLRLDCQRPRLGLHLQVLVPPVPFSSSTAVTTYASMKNLQHGLGQIPFRRTFGVTCMDLAIAMSSERSLAH